MRRRTYYKRAAKQFLAGTRFSAPYEMVQAGLKTLEEWADLLNIERDNDNLTRGSYRTIRKDRRSSSWVRSTKVV